MKKYNKQAIAEISVFTVFIIYMIYITVTNKYLKFVNPRILPYLYLMIGLFALWIINRIKILFKPMYKNNYTHLYILIIVFVVLVSPLKEIQISTLPQKYEEIPTLYVANEIEKREMVFLKDLLKDKSEINEEKTKEDSIVVTDSQHDSIKNNPNRMNAPFITNGLDLTNNEINVEDTYFMSWMYELSDYADLYRGFRITLKGFIYSDDTLKNNNSFLISRLLISCCVADLTPVGIISVYNGAHQLSDNSWFEVSGILDYANYNGKIVPVILIDKHTEISKPVVEYVYP